MSEYIILFLRNCIYVESFNNFAFIMIFFLLKPLSLFGWNKASHAVYRTLMYFLKLVYLTKRGRKAPEE